MGNEYDFIIHTTPPFYLYYDDPVKALEECYINSFDLAFSSSSSSSSLLSSNKILRVACPLLGFGARGFPMDIAIQIAVKTSIQWITSSGKKTQEDDNDDGDLLSEDKKYTIAFGLLELNDA